MYAKFFLHAKNYLSFPVRPLEADFRSIDDTKRRFDVPFKDIEIVSHVTHALPQFLLDDHHSWNRGDRVRDDVGVGSDVIDSAGDKKQCVTLDRISQDYINREYIKR